MLSTAVFEEEKSRIWETSNLSTDADSCTDTTVGWTKNTQKPKKNTNGTNYSKPKNSKTSRDIQKLAWFPPCFVRQNQQEFFSPRIPNL